MTSEMRLAATPPATSFASDNAAGVLPEVMDALMTANEGSALAYGEDVWTARATETFREVFGSSVEVALCYGGTGANVVALGSLCRSWEGVICPASAHINVDECGAPEKVAGVKLLPVPTTDGKLDPDAIGEAVATLGNAHHIQPKVVSISQSTEYGTLYTVDEIGRICDVAHRHGLLVHLDGARLANAAAALGVDVEAMTVGAGVDVISVGGTKAGMMYGEAVLLARPELAPDVPFVRKQSAQLPSKMRFIAAQFIALLTDDLWMSTARRANESARVLADRVGSLDGVNITQQPQVNAVFATLPKEAIAALVEWSFFWEWDHAAGEVRWMTSFATTIEDVDALVAGVAEAVGKATD